MGKVAALVFVTCLMAPQATFADDGNKVVGTWRLTSYEVEIQASGQREPVMGERPTGYATFTPEGRVFFVLTGEARKLPKQTGSGPSY